MNVFARCLAAVTLTLALGGCSASNPARASFATRLYATSGTNDSVMDAAIDEADDRVAIVTTNLDRTAVFLYRLGDGGLVAAYEQDCELDIRVLFSTSAHELVTACRRSRFDASTPAETTFTTFDASSGRVRAAEMRAPPNQHRTVRETHDRRVGVANGVAGYVAPRYFSVPRS